MSEMTTGTRFKRLLPDANFPNGSSDVKRMVFCSGKVVFDLQNARDAAGKQNEMAICTVEQIAPFPFDLVKEQANLYPNADIVWAQEEPKNMGAWFYTKPRIETALNKSDN